MAKFNYYTFEGLQRLKDELNNMITVQRPAISEQIAEARDKGDLSENAEYDAAKEAQGLLEAKIAKLQEVIANARVMDDDAIDTSKVFVLSTVKIRNIKLKKEFSYTLVAENEANIREGKISLESPIGKGLLGHHVGEVVEITTPAGTMNFEILEITR